MIDIRDAMQRAWGYKPPRSYSEMQRAGLFEMPSTPRNAWPPEIRRWNSSGQPPRVLLIVFEMDTPDLVLKGNTFVRDALVPGLVPIGGDSSGDDTRAKISGTTPVMHVPHDGGGGVYVAPSFAGFVYQLILENLQYLHFYESWGLTRADLATTTRRSAEAAAPWLLERWKRRIESVLEADVWPTYKTLPKLLARDPAFARLPRGEHDVFK